MTSSADDQGSQSSDQTAKIDPDSTVFDAFIGQIKKEFSMSPEEIEKVSGCLRQHLRTPLPPSMGDRDVRRQIRSELERLAKATVELQACLKGLSPDAMDMLTETKTNFERPELIEFHKPESHISNLSIDYWNEEMGDCDRLDFGDLLTILHGIKQSCELAHSVAGHDMRGRPANTQLNDLMEIAVYIWQRILNRPYKLDWHKDNSPISSAALFSERLAKFAFPESKPSAIANSSRKARELYSNSVT